MSGDWIKVEHATCDKPEVLRMAELLGVTRQEMLGKLLDFWVWLDRNSRHGCVTHMSRISLDNVTHCSGFSAALRDVGWVEIDDLTGQLTVKNFDRHNGNSAKSRALARDRKVTQRSRFSHAENVTREEKRREEKTNTTSAPNEKISFDAESGWSGILEADLKAWGEAFPAIDVKTEVARAREWARSHPANRKSNWRKFLTGWFGRAQDRAPAKAGNNGGYAPSKRVAL